MAFQEALTIAETEFGEKFTAQPITVPTTQSLIDYQFADKRDYTDEWVWVLSYRATVNTPGDNTCVEFAKMETNAVDGTYTRLQEEEVCPTRRDDGSIGSPVHRRNL